VFWIAVIPAFASFVVILFWVTIGRPATGAARAFVIVELTRMGGEIG
jgi:hypothetical protein